MIKNIYLGRISSDFEGGTIDAWHVKPGDSVKVGDVLLTVGTDKALVDVEAEDSGTIREILVEADPDAEVEVDTLIATMMIHE